MSSPGHGRDYPPYFNSHNGVPLSYYPPYSYQPYTAPLQGVPSYQVPHQTDQPYHNPLITYPLNYHTAPPSQHPSFTTSQHPYTSSQQQQQSYAPSQQQHAYGHARTAAQYRSRNLSAPQKLTSDFPQGSLNPVSKDSDYSDMKTSYRHGNLTTGSPSSSAVSPLKVNVEDMFLKKATSHGISITPPQGSPQIPVTMETSLDSLKTTSGDSALKTLCSTASVQAALKHSADNTSVINPVTMTTASSQKPVGSNWTKAGLAPGWKQSSTTPNNNSEIENSTPKPLKAINPSRSDLFFERAWKLGIICSKPQTANMDNANTNFKTDKFKTLNQINDIKSSFEVNNELIKSADCDPIVEKMEELYVSVAKKITHDIMCSAIIEINAEYGMAVEVDDFLKGVEDLLKDADNRKYQVSDTNEVYNRNYQVSDTNEEPVYDSEFTNLNLQNVVKASSISSSQTSLLNPDTPEFKPINIDVVESYLPFQRIPISPDNSDDNCNNNNAIYCDSQYYSCRNDDKFVNICDDFEPQMIFDLVDKGVNTEDNRSPLKDTETQTENIDNNILNQSVPLVDLTPYSDELVDCETQTENTGVDAGIKTQPLNEALANSAPKVKTRNRKLQTDNEMLGQLPSDSPGYSYMKILEKEVYSLRGQMCLNEIQREIQELYNTKSRWTSFFTPKHGGSVGLDEMLNDRIVWLEHYFTKLQTQLEEGMKCLENGVRLGELPEFSIYIPTASGNTMCLPKSVMKPSKFSFKDTKTCFTVPKQLNDISNVQDSVTSNVSPVNLLIEESTQSQLNSKSKDFTESQINPKPNQSQMLNYGIGFEESTLIPTVLNQDSNLPKISIENHDIINSEITSMPAQDKSSMDSNISAQDTLKKTNTDSDSDRTETDSMEMPSCLTKQNTSAGHSTSESELSFDKSAKHVSKSPKEYSADLDPDTDIPSPNILTFADLINRHRSKQNSTSNVEKCSVTPNSTSNVEKCLNFTPSSSSIVETNNSASSTSQSFSDHATEPFNDSANLLASSALSTGKAPDLVKQSNSCIITEQNNSADHLVSSVRKTSDRDISDHATEQDNSAKHLASRTEKTPNRVNQNNSCIVTKQNNSANHLASSALSITKTSDMVNKSCPDDAKDQNDSVNHSNSNILKCSNTSNATVTDIAREQNTSQNLITDSNLTNVTTCLTTSVAIPKSVAVPLNKSNIKELLQELKTTNVKNNPPKYDSDNPLLSFIKDTNQNNSQSKSLVPSSESKSNSSDVLNSQFDSFDAFSRERFLESQQKVSTPDNNCFSSSKDPVSSIQSRANGDNSLTLPTGCNLIESPNGVQKCQTTKLTSPAEHKLGTIEEVSEFIVDDHGEDACCLSTSLLKKLTTIPEETETFVFGSDKNIPNSDETAKESNKDQDGLNLIEIKMSRSVDDGCKNKISDTEDTTISLNINNSNSVDVGFLNQDHHNIDLKTEIDLRIIELKENSSDDAAASLNNPVENFQAKDLPSSDLPIDQINNGIDIDELTEKVDTYLSEEQKKKIIYYQEKCKGIDIDELTEKVDTYLSEERKKQIIYCQEKCNENSIALDKLCKSLDRLENRTGQSIENTDKEDVSGIKKITPVNDKSAIKKQQKNNSSSQIDGRDHNKQDLLGGSLQSENTGAKVAVDDSSFLKIGFKDSKQDLLGGSPQSDDIVIKVAVGEQSEPKEINKNDAGQQNLVDPKFIKDDTEDAEGNQSESCRDQKVSCIETKIKTPAVKNQSNSVTEPAVSVNPQIPRSSVEKSSAVNKDLLIPCSSKERSSEVNQDLLKAVMTQLVADYPNLLLNPEHLEKLAIHQTQLLQSYIPGGDNNNSQDAASTGNTVSTSTNTDSNPVNKTNAQSSSLSLVQQQHSQFQNPNPNQTVMISPNNYSCPKTNKGSFEGSDNISTGASSSGKSSPVFMNNPVSKQETQPSENSEQFKLPSTHQFVPPGITMQPARCQFVPVSNIGPRFLATNNSVNQPPMMYSGGPSPQMFMPFSPFPPQPNVQMLQPYPMQLSNPVLMPPMNMCGPPPQTQSSLKGAQFVTNPLQSRNTLQNGIRFNAHQSIQQVPVATSHQIYSESASKSIDRLPKHFSPNVDRLSEHSSNQEAHRKEPSLPESIKSYLVERKKARSVKRRNLFTSSDFSCDEDGMDSDAGGGFNLNKSVDSSFFKSCGSLRSSVLSGRLIPDPAVPSTATSGSAQSGVRDVPCGTRLDVPGRLADPHPNTSGQFGGRDVPSGTRLDAPGRLTAPHPNTSGQSAASCPTGSAQSGVESTRSNSSEKSVPSAVSLKSTAQTVLSAANATCESLRSSVSANTNTTTGLQFPLAGCPNSKTKSQIPSPLNLDNLSGKRTQSQIPPLQNFPSLKQDLVSNTSNITENTKPRKRNKTAPEAAPVPQKAPQKASNDDWDTEVDPYPTTFTFVSAPKRPLNFGDNVSNLCSFGAAVVPHAPNSISATNQTLSTKKKTAEKLSNSKSDPSRVNTQFLGRLLKSAESSNERKKLKSNSAETSRFVDTVVSVTSPVSTDTENLSDDWVTVPTNKKPKKAKVEVPAPKVTKATSKKSQGQGSKAAKGEGAAFDRLIELMSQRIPNVTRQDVLYIISHIRQKKGSLKGIPLNDIIDTGKQLMASKQKPCPVPRDTQFAKDLPPRFKRLVEKSSLEMPVTLACDEGDICVICCDELDVEKTKSLDCGHTFHIMCINEWVYKHERTCPTCRKIALFPDEFPELGK